MRVENRSLTLLVGDFTATTFALKTYSVVENFSELKLFPRGKSGSFERFRIKLNNLDCGYGVLVKSCLNFLFYSITYENLPPRIWT